MAPLELRRRARGLLLGRTQRAANARFVESLYRDLLGRAPDPAGLDAHLRLLASGRDRADVVLAIANSEEFARRAARREADDAVFVDRLYRELLGRPIDASGTEHYAGLLDGGADHVDVVLDIVRSEEYEHRVVRSHVVLPDLVTQRPDRYRQVPATGSASSPGELVPVFVVEGPDDFDWLEDAILTGGYYERPGIWTLGIDQDKRVMAELLASLGRERALELGCASGAVIECLEQHGIYAEGLEISRAAIRRATPHIAERIHCADLLEADLPSYDLVYGLDIFEHFNPNRLGSYLKRVADLVTDGGLLFANIPAFGDDPVFGTVFEMFLDEWNAAADAGRPFSYLQVDEDGYPMHGHLTWATTGWWQQQFEQAGFRREVGMERDAHARFDAAIEAISPARRSFYVFSKRASD